MITNTESGTNVNEIADGIYRINTPIRMPDGFSFNFNQYLIGDDAPLLFHTGPRRMFPLVHEAVSHVVPVARLRHVGFSHFEADECGALNEWLAAAPNAIAFASRIAAMVSMNDVADRQGRALADGETLSLGRRTVKWFDTPHTPHGWDAGLMMEVTTGTFLCGDLFTQGGDGVVPVTEADIVEPSEAFRATMDYYAHSPETTNILERLASERPTTLAVMHGSAFRGDGATALRELAKRLTGSRPTPG